MENRMKHIHLQTLIEELEKLPQDGIVPFGFGAPDSYRGYYSELAFVPMECSIISEMLDHAKSALGKTFTGYKGGEYTMGEYAECYIAEYGCSAGDKIGMTLIKMWQYVLTNH